MHYGRKANLFLKVRKSQIHKFLGSIRIHKYANFFGMPVHKLKIFKFLLLIPKAQIRKFLQNTAQLCLKTVLKVLLDFLLHKNFNIELIMRF